MAKRELWMQRALRRKPGALRRQLGIPKSKKIPVSLLRRIQEAETGETVKNPTRTGRRTYKVTTLLQRRVNPVLTVHKLYRQKKRRRRRC